ncbi:hypothetical protein [Pseudonocardia xinjiangensis]|uniref:Uncharacterized protein n=1 Tax=Pseudonocardia xinjiangensis TaxID=75289 RepID=A0ABX1RKH9_9PSEU|nr:hypothetical protein [Pseudonocardia xinjiangensis]NMH80863.1 hypothetical protein [Pseudonocardia xinjiangensis]
MQEIDNTKARERLEIHNCSVDEQLAKAHLCGRVHLPTGRTCALPEAHSGGCAFEPVKRAERTAQSTSR